MNCNLSNGLYCQICRSVEIVCYTMILVIMSRREGEGEGEGEGELLFILGLPLILIFWHNLISYAVILFFHQRVILS
jgi:hypothetical protein